MPSPSFLARWRRAASLTGTGAPSTPATPPTLELYDVRADPAEAKDVAAGQRDVVARLHAQLREFGRWQKAGVSAYDAGREGFVAPKDWIPLQ